MDAVEFYRQFARYCSSSYCSECTIVESCKTKGKDGRDADKIVRMIEQWAKAHPVKTRQSEFLKLFPNADLCRDVINILPCSVEKGMSKCCSDKRCEECRKDYWLTEVDDDD
nr:MAG TPA: hypothetical protein [Caudoviricetes sp.]